MHRRDDSGWHLDEHADAHAHRHADTNGDSHANGDADADRDADEYGDAHGDTYADPGQLRGRRQPGRLRRWQGSGRGRAGVARIRA